MLKIKYNISEKLKTSLLYDNNNNTKYNSNIII